MEGIHKTSLFHETFFNNSTLTSPFSLFQVYLLWSKLNLSIIYCLFWIVTCSSHFPNLIIKRETKIFFLLRPITVLRQCWACEGWTDLIYSDHSDNDSVFCLINTGEVEEQQIKLFYWICFPPIDVRKCTVEEKGVHVSVIHSTPQCCLDLRWIMRPSSQNEKVE